MKSGNYTPQEAAAIAALPLPTVQKAITAKQLPALRVGKSSRRLIDETSLLALALARSSPALTAREARRLLIENGYLQAEDVKSDLVLVGKARIDLLQSLAPVLRRIGLFRRAQELISARLESGQQTYVIKGTSIDPETLRNRIRSGSSLEEVQREFPDLDKDAIEAAALWADAKPRRGRPKAPTPDDEPLVPALRDVSAWSRTMRITAQQIDGWAHGERARSALPILARRLVNASGGSIVKIDFPGGDAVSQPGWDAEILSERGTAWVPQGRTFWEVSCEASVASKANTDYKLRTENTPQEVRTNSIYVALTARRWPKKKKWLEEKRQLNEWADVRAYDANDLEQALEANPAVALWFASELGLAGNGVESPIQFWENWSQQCDPPISKDAIFTARENLRDRLIATIRKRIEADTFEPLMVKADSVGEAAAFVCAAISQQNDLSGSTLVVTDQNGWRFIEQNSLLKVAIAARTEIAENPTRRKGTVVIIPFATGDFPSQYHGAAARKDDTALELYRPETHKFEEALVHAGFEKSEAKRLAANTGRSWSVVRRHRAKNPALSHPLWLDLAESRALSTLCLLGSWSGRADRDREIVAKIAGRPYEEVERDLRRLGESDDPPVLAIGEVWKAKSSLELLDLYGSRITSDEVTRFLGVAAEVLTAEDPQLELEEDKRFAAAIYGKVRPESALLRQALCDTLIKLAVRGQELRSLASLNIEAKIGRFVHELLADAGASRWLSLVSNLRYLAEAAPTEFLSAVAKSLERPDAPVTALISETSGTAITGRCWHADLLWALERLAWAPNRLGKVSRILARLSHTPVKGNWSNTPLRSLHGIFRPWLPQTAATLDQRNAVLDLLIAKEPSVAFELLSGLINVGHDFATPADRPDWRDDDAGAGHGATNSEYRAALISAAERFLRCAGVSAESVARAIDRITDLYTIDGIDKCAPTRTEQVLKLADRFAQPGASDEDKETIRAELRDKIHWYRNYGGEDKGLPPFVDAMDALYVRSAPRDLVLRHRWLFAKNWIDVPVREKDVKVRASMVDEIRKDALKEIVEVKGLPGIKELADTCVGSVEIGISLAALDLDIAQLAHWIVGASGDLTRNDPMRAPLHGLLRATASPKSAELLSAILKLGREEGWSNERIANCLASARDERETWNVVASQGAEIEEVYWRVNTPGFWLPNNPADFEYALRKLVAAKRPRTALNAAHLNFDKVDPGLLADMLDGMLRGEELDANVLSSYDIANAIKRLEISGAIPEDRLIRIEFGLIPALGFQGEHKAVALYRALLSQPELFVECLRLVYKPKGGSGVREATEGEKTAAHIAWQVLHHCKRLPGVVDSTDARPVAGPVDLLAVLKPDSTEDTPTTTGPIQPAEFKKFVEETRALAQAEGRLEVCDIILGQIMAHAPADDDGKWPCAPVRDFLDRAELEDMRSGFRTGLFNKRGSYWGSPTEGGVQERQIAATYRSLAEGLSATNPFVAETLETLAKWYEGDARRADDDARLRLENY